MSGQYKKFLAEWKAIDRKINDVYGKLDSAAQSESNLKDWLEGAREDIIEKVFAAKKSGTDGTTLADFLSDKDVKSAWATITKTLKTLEKAHVDFQNGVKEMKALYDDATKVKDEARKAIDKKKKQVGKSKSKGDLEDLAAEISKVLKQPSKKLSSVETYGKMKPAAFDYDRRYQGLIDADIKAGKNKVKVIADGDAAVQRLTVRHLAKVQAQLKKDASEVKALCIRVAMRARDGKKDEAKAALVSAKSLVDAANQQAAQYGNDLKRNKTAVEYSQDAKKIKAGVLLVTKSASGMDSDYKKVAGLLG